MLPFFGNNNENNFHLIAIIGQVPLPYGGVTVHLNRLLNLLRSESIEYDFYDLDGKNDLKFQIYPGKRCLFWIFMFLLRSRRRYKLVHFHTSNPYILLLADILTISSGVRLAYSLHGEGVYRCVTKTGPCFLRWALRNTLRRADHIFAINPTIAKKLPELGIEPARVSWMAAYLPPTDQEMDPKPLSTEACDFLETHSPVIAMQAWFGSFHEGNDIYGLEQIVPLLQELRMKYPNAGICTVISGSYCSKHRNHILALRKEAGLENDWLFVEGGGPAVALFQRCNLFLRPTITDGDSLSIRECLSFGVPVVASDAVVRPESCTIYPKGDTNVMIDAVLSVLEYNSGGKLNKINSDSQDYAKPLLDYYRKVLKLSSLE